MYFYLTQAISLKIVQELRRFWSYHPKYREDLPQFIQTKYRFEERPQMGIVCKGGSGTPHRLSADNYVGLIDSYVVLARANRKPGLSVEWVREESRAIQANDGRFPAPAGVYYVNVDTHDQVSGKGLSQCTLT